MQDMYQKVDGRFDASMYFINNNYMKESMIQFIFILLEHSCHLQLTRGKYIQQKDQHTKTRCIYNSTGTVVNKLSFYDDRSIDRCLFDYCMYCRHANNYDDDYDE